MLALWDRKRCDRSAAGFSDKMPPVVEWAVVGVRLSFLKNNVTGCCEFIQMRKSPSNTFAAWNRKVRGWCGVGCSDKQVPPAFLSRCQKQT